MLVTFEQTQVMVARHRGQAVGQESSAAVACLDLDQIALFSKVGDVFGQNQLHAAMRAFTNSSSFGWRVSTASSKSTSVREQIKTEFLHR